jgi:catechol 2,3-dioxygenase-like lactoylglutathione lyase family enzyme
MMLKFVDHIDMLVTDLEAQITFFEKLGFIIKRRLPDHGNAVEMQLPGEDQVVFEMRACGDKEPGIRHIAFRVENENTVSELKANGVVFRTESKFVPATGRTVSNANDPNGNSWQLTD